MNAPTSTDSAPRWARLVLFLFGIPQLVVGVWAVIAPEHWFDNFPGLGPVLVAAEPPFNHHLANDAGAGFLATGVFVVVAALWGLRPLVLVAAGVLAVFAVPHFIYHALHPADLLSDRVNLANSVILFVAAAVPVAVVVAVLPRRRKTTTEAKDRS